MYLTRAILVLFVVTLAEGQTDRSMPNLQAGRKIFESQCALCHGANGGGGRGPSLHRPKLERAPDDAALARISLTLASKGGIRTETLRAFTEDEYRKIISGIS